MDYKPFKFFGKFCLFALPFLVWAYVISWKNEMIVAQNETESNVLITPSNAHFKYVFLGASQSRTFTREGNFIVLDSLLGTGNYLNLSKGGGGGILPAYISLKYFYDRGNSTEKVIFFINPRAFYSIYANENHPLFTKEPFRIDFFMEVFFNTWIPWKNRKQYIYQIWEGNSISADLIWKWRKSESDFKKFNLTSMKKSRQRLKKEFEDGKERMSIYKNYNQQLIHLAETNGSEIIYIILPTLVEELPGMDEMKVILTSQKVNLQDHSNGIQDPTMFYDFMHLNKKGVRLYFSKYFLNN